MDNAKSMLGTMLTMAPEVMKSNKNQSYTSKCDLWSIGCVYYQMLIGESPFYGFCPSDILRDIN